ncbi:hypothetical protein [Budvicia diplopodorum]|uniref:hypothetical protein n=1 Tax=Budvicia diplopodorum TaxID=1119056 RepID=UPI00135AD22F|nr:hypothetical protein [Budvicia diplopodorum]
MNYIAKTSVKRLFILITGIVSLSAVNAWAASSGQVTFIGAVTEPTCDVAYNNNAVINTCMENNKPVVSKIRIDRVTDGSQKLVGNSMMAFSWVDKSQKLGLATITYH